MIALTRSPLLLDIKHNSIDDGPGIRSVIFFKGCPLNCRWCHNPESKLPGPGISYDVSSCIRCDTCQEVCPQGAISAHNPFFVNRSRCNYCYQCSDKCPSGALSRVGRETAVQEIIEAVMRYKPFYVNSGGGVTFSGGEPTLFPEFVGKLAEQLKQTGIHILMETCGYFNYDKFSQSLLQFVDMIYYDIKLMDEGEHLRYCGVSNRIILANLAQLTNESAPIVVPRMPLIPGITDTVNNVRAAAGYLREIGLPKIVLLPNNPTWLAKKARLGLETEIGDDVLGEFLSEERVVEINELFEKEGVTVC